MPIHVPISTRRLSQTEFGEVAYRVMEHAFEVHNQFGRLFDETIYQNELAERIQGARIEVPITVSHGTFSKRYSADFFVGEGAVFELKCVDSIHPRQRAQLTNYLLMTDLAHGKIINFRPPKIEHEFANCTARLEEQKSPEYVYQNWDVNDDRLVRFDELLRELIADWGVGLDRGLYHEAVNHFIGKDSEVIINGSNGSLGATWMPVIASGVAYRITAINGEIADFRSHVGRLLSQTSLDLIVWVNLTMGAVRFELIGRNS